MSDINFIPLSPDCPHSLNFKSVLALGCFDGFHAAHKKIADATIALSRKKSSECQTDVLPGAFCFASSPSNYLGVSTPNITDITEKIQLFGKAGLKFAVLADFREIRDLSASDFLNNIITDKCRCVGCCCGFNFTFGKGATGTVSDLIQYFGQENTTVVPKMTVDNEIVSSSRIRQLIKEGNVERANKLLLHPFSITGEVCHGRGDGRKFGFPTLNQFPEDNALIPLSGVYVTAVKTDGSSALFPAVTDVGSAPTVESNGRLRYETHLLIDGDRSLYGTTPKVFFFKRLRSEKRFSSSEELCKQISDDIDNAKEYFKSHPEFLNG